MNQLRSVVSAFLDKVSLILKSEPARAIGYGAAAVVFLVGKVLADRGYVQFNLSFEDSVITALAAMTLVGSVVESIRRFVYSPQTYIEDLADEFQQEAMRADFWFSAFEQAIAEQQSKRKRTVPVGTPKAGGSGDLSN